MQRIVKKVPCGLMNVQIYFLCYLCSCKKEKESLSEQLVFAGMNPNEIIHRYYQKGTKLYDIYISHVTDVTNKALRIAGKHPGLALDVKFVEEAALLHDIGIFKTRAPHIACQGNMPYVCHGYLGCEILTHLGYPKHGKVCERHTGTGITLESILQRNLPIPHRDMCPQTLEEKLICFADKFYSKSQLGREKSVKKIRDGVAGLMKRENLKNMAEVQSYFGKRVENIILAKGKKMMGWDEILEGGISN